MESMNPVSKLRALAGRYRHAILVLLIGLGLMLLPTGKTEEQTAGTDSAQLHLQTEPAEEDLEARLEQILGRISGAGEVEVLLTEAVGREILYQTDEETDADGESSQKSVSTVIIEDSDSSESGLIRRTDPPVYQGAVVVCQGGDDPQVRLAIVEAVRCATGLGADQITVVKMN